MEAVGGPRRRAAAAPLEAVRPAVVRPAVGERGAAWISALGRFGPGPQRAARGPLENPADRPRAARQGTGPGPVATARSPRAAGYGPTTARLPAAPCRGGGATEPRQAQLQARVHRLARGQDQHRRRGGRGREPEGGQQEECRAHGGGAGVRGETITKPSLWFPPPTAPYLPMPPDDPWAEGDRVTRLSTRIPGLGTASGELDLAIGAYFAEGCGWSR